MFKTNNKKHHWVHATNGITVTKNMKFHKASTNKLCLKQKKNHQVHASRDIRIAKNMKIVILLQL